MRFVLLFTLLLAACGAPPVSKPSPSIPPEKAKSCDLEIYATDVVTGADVPKAVDGTWHVAPEGKLQFHARCAKPFGLVIR